MVTDPKVLSPHCGFSRKPHTAFTPESCSLLRLRSRCFRWEGLDFSAETRQLISDNVQSSKLKKKKGNGNSKQLRPKFLKKLEQTNKTFFYICIKKTSSLVFDIQIISILSISQYVMYFALLIRQKKFTLFRGKSPPWGEQKPVRRFCVLLLEI